MRKVAGWWLTVCSLGASLAQPSAAQAPYLLQPAAMRADLARFHAALRGGHAALAKPEAGAHLDSVYAQLLTEAAQPRRPEEFFRLVLRLTASVHDGHTLAFATGALRDTLNARGLLPFHVTIQHDRIFVLRNLSDARIPEGSEILSIDGVPSPTILARLADHFGVDGGSRSGIQWRLGSEFNAFYRVYPQVFGFPATHHVALRDYLTRTVRVLDLPRIGPGDFQERDKARYGALLHAWSRDSDLAVVPLELHLHEDSGYADLRIRRFFKDDIEEREDVYPSLLREAFRRIDDAHIHRLVLDIRGNGGGDGANVAHLLTYLVTRPFTPTTRIAFRGGDAYYAQFTRDSLGLDDYFGFRRERDAFVVTRADRIRELRAFSPATRYHYDGALAVLIDGGTVSAAGMAAGMLQEHTNAILVGEEAGGYAGMSNGIRQLAVRAENAPIGINFPLAHSEFDVNEQRRARGALPDYPASSSIHDILQHRDAVLQIAIEMLQKKGGD